MQAAAGEGARLRTGMGQAGQGAQAQRAAACTRAWLSMAEARRHTQGRASRGHRDGSASSAGVGIISHVQWRAADRSRWAAQHSAASLHFCKPLLLFCELLYLNSQGRSGGSPACRHPGAAGCRHRLRGRRMSPPPAARCPPPTAPPPPPPRHAAQPGLSRAAGWWLQREGRPWEQ